MSSEITNNNDYEVGYRKPPRSSQFQKGKSGNPSGKRKPGEKQTFAGAFAKSLHEMIDVPENGKTVRLSRKHLGVRRRVEEAAKGNLRALKELLKLRDAKEEAALSSRQHVHLSLEEISAAGPLEDTLNSKDVVIVREPKPSPGGVDGKVCHDKRIRKGQSGNPKGGNKCNAPQTFKALIELELGRCIWTTDAATGERKRMSMREVIVGQLTRMFAAGKAGASDLLLKLDQHPAIADTDYRVRVLVPWNYEIPARPN